MKIFFFFLFFCFLITLVSGQPRSQLSSRRGSSAPAEGMLNPLWLGLEVVMAGTSAEVPLPPDHEVRFPKIIFAVRTSTYVVSKNKHILMLYLMYIKLSNWDYIRCLVVMFQCLVNWPCATHSYFSSIYVRFSLALVEFTLFNKSEMDLHWLWSNLLGLTSQR